jgi:hypothetical protein
MTKAASLHLNLSITAALNGLSGVAITCQRKFGNPSAFF